jgi:GH15 family glucan-1,4-alpha-glucosidase
MIYYSGCQKRAQRFSVARPVILSNNTLAVGLNQFGLVHDFYYPYIGEENLTSAREASHKIGVWINDKFSWVDDGTWESKVTFENDALISIVHLKNRELGVELLLNDFVDSKSNAFIRNIKVKNTGQKSETIKVFMHQMFELSRNGRGDTAMFVPEESYILDYKGKTSILIYAQDEHDQPFHQFAIGNYAIEGKKGTYVDAEDGELSGNTIEHGGVDSVIGFDFDIKANEYTEINYWLIAGNSQSAVAKIHQQHLKVGVDNLLNSTRDYWHAWLSTGSEKLSKIENDLLPMATKSLLLIKAHMDKNGGIVASCDSAIYNYGRDYYSYVWPRDGAFAIWPLIKLGYTKEPKQFFEFCEKVLHEDGYMMHKYNPDTSVGSTWHPLQHGKYNELAIQEDESAIIIVLLYDFFKQTKDTEFAKKMYQKLTLPIANFLNAFIDESTGLPHASYDLWEEKFGTHTYTTAVTYRALLSATEFAKEFGDDDNATKWNKTANVIADNLDAFINPESGVLRKGYLLDKEKGLSFDNTLDSSSFYGVVKFGLPIDKSVLQATIHAIENDLLDKIETKGLPRYSFDNYFAISKGHIGNPWVVTTLWYAQFKLMSGERDVCNKYLLWAKKTALPSGALPEQSHPINGSAVSVTPLVWSHAEFLYTILELQKKY